MAPKGKGKAKAKAAGAKAKAKAQGRQTLLAFPTMEDEESAPPPAADEQPPDSKRPRLSIEDAEQDIPAAQDMPEQKEKEKEEEEEDTDLEIVDTRAPSRGTRYVFESKFSELPEWIQKAYNDEKVSRVPGKQKRMNAIINKAVRQKGLGYRASLRSDPVQWEKIHKNSDKKYKDDRAEGYSYTQILGILHTDAAIQAGIDRGDVEVEEDDGRKWFYMGRKTSGRITSSEKKESSGQKKTLTDENEKMQLELDMADDSWMVFPALMGGSGSSSSSSGQAMPTKVAVSDQMLMKVQQAHTAVNSSQSSLRTSSLKLRGKIDQVIVASACEQMRIATECLTDLENILLSPRESLFEDEVKEKMVAIATKYQYIRMKQAELQALEKGFKPPSTSGSGC